MLAAGCALGSPPPASLAAAGDMPLGERVDGLETGARSATGWLPLIVRPTAGWLPLESRALPAPDAGGSDSWMLGCEMRRESCVSSPTSSAISPRSSSDQIQIA
jgi:hypothetical protein